MKYLLSSILIYHLLYITYRAIMEDLLTIPYESISIKINDQTIPIHIDINGNIYLAFMNNLYQLCVENDNPYLDQGNYNIVVKDNFDVDDSDDFDGVYSEKCIEGQQRHRVGKMTRSHTFYDDKYFPEENGYTFSHKEDDSLENDSYFIFYGKDLHPKERNNGDVQALYDTFIYDDNDKDNTSLVFCSKMQNEMSIYRCCIYTSGKIYFRPIGCAVEKNYELSIKDNILQIV